MRIKQINIAEFGCLKERIFEFSNGMNIIEGENESGKSTLLLFIKFMLYGLGRKGAANVDRARSVSWSGHTAAGSMLISHGENEYRIERRFVDSGRSGSESLHVYRLVDGEELKLSGEPGEYFLGVPREVFESSACVSQMRSSEINGEKTATSIQNLLSSADENVDTANILKKLDSARVGLLHKNRAGGSLYDDEKKIKITQKALDEARESSFKLDAIEQKLSEARERLNVTRNTLAAKEKLLSEFNKVSILRRFADKREREHEREKIAKAQEKLKADTLMTDFFPTQAYLAELSLSAKALAEAKANTQSKQLKLDAASVVNYDAELCALGERLEAEGGEAIVIAHVDGKKKKIKKTKGLLTLMLSCVGVAVIACAVTLAVLFNIPVLACGALSVLLAAICTPTLLVQIKRTRSELSALAEAYGALPETLPERLVECRNELLTMREHTAALELALAQLNDARAAENTAHDRLKQLLNKTAPALSATVENVRTESARLEAFLSEYKKLGDAIISLDGSIAADSASLAEYNEEELSRELQIDASTVTDNLMANTKRERDYVAYQKTTFENRINELSAESIRMSASAKDPIEIADELTRLEEGYAADKRFYNALTLAMESIERAGEIMGGNIIPQIAHRAGELMARISDDKYNTVRTTANLDLSVDSDGFAVRSDLLSGGTRDAAYLSLRISLFMRIFAGEEPPLILDEAFCQLDDKRARRLLKLLSGLCTDGAQCLLFTSHKREREFSKADKIEFNKIAL